MEKCGFRGSVELILSLKHTHTHTHTHRHTHTHTCALGDKNFYTAVKIPAL